MIIGYYSQLAKYKMNIIHKQLIFIHFQHLFLTPFLIPQSGKINSFPRGGRLGLGLLKSLINLNLNYSGYPILIKGI